MNRGTKVLAILICFHIALIWVLCEIGISENKTIVHVKHGITYTDIPIEDGYAISEWSFVNGGNEINLIITFDKDDT